MLDKFSQDNYRVINYNDIMAMMTLASYSQIFLSLCLLVLVSQVLDYHDKAGIVTLRDNDTL